MFPKGNFYFFIFLLHNKKIKKNMNFIYKIIIIINIDIKVIMLITILELMNWFKII